MQQLPKFSKTSITNIKLKDKIKYNNYFGEVYAIKVMFNQINITLRLTNNKEISFWLTPDQTVEKY